jgi:hypothetical protein
VNFGAIHTTSMVGFFFSFIRIDSCDESITWIRISPTRYTTSLCIHLTFRSFEKR